MAWNEPGNSGGKNPWGGGGGDKGKGPPDLDEVLKKWQRKLSGMFGGKGGGRHRETPPADGGPSLPTSPTLIYTVIAIVLGLWGLTGVYIVDSAERGVVLRFGEYVDVALPGPHWHLPYPIESHELVDVDQVRKVEVGYRGTSTGRDGAGSIPQESQMLTQDENIVDIRFAVQYHVKEAKDYLFNVKEPEETLRQATETAVREVIGKSKMDFVLTEGQSEIADQTKRLIQEILDRYRTGLIVTSVNLQSAQPPQEVKPAFDDAIKAREDEQRVKNEAQAYANGVVPRARGAAARQLEEATAYKSRVVAQAEGEAARFLSLLEEYKKAPQVTRQRLYLETMESVMSKSSKVMVDTKGGNGNMLYLPLDKMMGNVAPTAPVPSMPAATTPDMLSPRDADDRRRNSRTDLRQRETR